MIKNRLSLAIGAALLFTQAGCQQTSTWYADTDLDGFGDAASFVKAAEQPDGYVANDQDCNDTNSAINPGATELFDSIDNNCNGVIDEGFTPVTWYLDNDADTYGDAGTTTDAVLQPAGYVADSSDCNDNNSAINPAAAEIWDGADNNCNGQIDEGFSPTTWYLDSDSDSFGDSTQTTLDITQPAGYVANSSDCNDSDASINPGATEVWDSIDNNCDGEVDEGFTPVTWFEDSDGDNYGTPSSTTVDVEKPDGFVANSLDCNDADAAINPGATEVWDSIDNNCDGVVDEGFTPVTWYEDSDADSFGNPAVSTVDVVQPAGYVTDNQDCDDTAAAINPAAAELWDSIDNNCNGEIDEGFTPVTYYLDSDADNYGDSSNTVVDITLPAGYAELSGDCDDSNPAINPGAAEQYDSIDNNCNGEIDEGFDPVSYYFDGDSDGYGIDGDTVVDIAPPAGYTEANGDCDDANPAVNPGATELYDGIDNNCDAQIDEGFDPQTYYFDGDSDGFGDDSDTVLDITQPAGYVAQGGDCNDANALINPAAVEQYDSLDNNCNGEVDEGFDPITWYYDGDSDTFGDPSVTTLDITQPSGYVANSGDCDDSNGSVNPDAAEIADGIDNDCNGVIDDVACVPVPAGQSYVEIEYDLSHTQYAITGTPLSGAGDGTFDFDTGTMTVRFESDSSGNPTPGGSAEVVWLTQDQLFSVSTDLGFLGSGTVTTNAVSSLVLDSRWDGVLYSTLTPGSAVGTLNAAGDQITFSGGLDNFHTEGNVSCTGASLVCNNAPLGPIDDTPRNIGLTQIDLGTASVNGTVVDLRTNFIVINDDSQSHVEEAFGGMDAANSTLIPGTPGVTCP
jgi:hypothetical protein